MKRLLSTVLVLALGGCALMDSEPQPLAALDAAKLGLTGQAAEWPATQWWERYGDPQLNALMVEALANSPSMSAAQARLAKANAAVSTARAPLLPRVDADYSLTREHLSKDYIYPAPLGGSVVSDNRLALDFSYELDFWGKNRSRLQSAVSQQEAAAADEQAARNMLASATVRAYLNLQNAFSQRDVLNRVLAQRAEVLALTQGRYSAGLDTQVEVKQAESSLAAGKVELTQTETTLAQLRNQVAALAGAGPQRGQALTPVALTAPAGSVPASVPLDLLGHRPDVTAARWRAEAARHAIDSAKAEFYPNVNLAAFVGFQAMGTGNLLGADARMAGFGPAVTLPIFHGGELNANLAGRRAEADLAVSDYNQTVLDAAHQVADALDGLRLLDQEKAQQRQAREAIEAAYDLAVKRYKAGMGNYITVLIAQTGVLTQARLDTDLRIRAYQLDANLATALGGGYAPRAESAPNPIH
ncbi:efflux transporter outer membrane subunit [Achromobacter deleyi]|uniref:efflux transporter outer membrane subunit n=1 Tax=Achromobacter deleyi TaxID=1353891 RepID=UPI0014918A0C|nr:efflux transporter outer membrane subunit [Achromobacter deleyi]QVQ29235.1 efflux transporter outer membrane subunit [Achromobacter deleyi]UIP19356.1 efflux transporter outer membrane subunit [Achromobacter deleyi]